MDSSKTYKGFKSVVRDISWNENKVFTSNEFLSHREIMYLASALELSKEMDDMPSEIHFLIASLKVRGLSHKVRSFIANRILSILEKAEITQDNCGEF